MAMSWQYIAGFFDGEGNVNPMVGGGSIGVLISISQADERGKKVFMDMIDFMSSHGIRGSINKLKRVEGRRPIYRIIIASRFAVLKFIESCMPYLHIKKLECQDAWRYLTIYPALKKKSHTDIRESVYEGKCCPNGHQLTEYNISYKKLNGKLYIGCRLCKVSSANDRYHRVLQPIMQDLGIGVRDINAKIISDYWTPRGGVPLRRRPKNPTHKGEAY